MRDLAIALVPVLLLAILVFYIAMRVEQYHELKAEEAEYDEYLVGLIRGRVLARRTLISEWEPERVPTAWVLDRQVEVLSVKPGDPAVRRALIGDGGERRYVDINDIEVRP